MKKQDMLTLIGVVVGAAMLVWGMALGGANLKIFWDFSSLVITVFGSFCALLINYPISEFKKLGKVLLESFKEPILSQQEMVSQFGSLSRKARKEGLLSLEDDISKLEDAFLKKGLQMVVDGIEPETIKDIMELEIDEMERRHITGANILKAWGGYAPAFGMIGTLIGLIQMLSNLTDSNAIASGMAKALITTYYGAVMANLFFNPMSANLSLKSGKEVATREMMLEGILSIQSGVNPRIVEEKLITYLSPKERMEYAKISSTGQGGTIDG
ncbi:motility protein A [Clostridium algidicarnis]|uniref:Motility protein A n=1 Tax=Clostridium algidicarnis TaxID=37659 RepID=A0ABS6BZB8_9CLOT|nr:motility protein A [Clostridium algidicarnis]MBB6630460.1 motility protein A [Clostridium algidicarnis]MBU3218560.1 motility protein A [Clostridium algidicarnis]